MCQFVETGSGKSYLIRRSEVVQQIEGTQVTKEWKLRDLTEEQQERIAEVIGKFFPDITSCICFRWPPDSARRTGLHSSDQGSQQLGCSCPSCATPSRDYVLLQFCVGYAARSWIFPSENIRLSEGIPLGGDSGRITLHELPISGRQFFLQSRVVECENRLHLRYRWLDDIMAAAPHRRALFQKLVLNDPLPSLRSTARRHTAPSQCVDELYASHRLQCPAARRQKEIEEIRSCASQAHTVGNANGGTDCEWHSDDHLFEVPVHIGDGSSRLDRGISTPENKIDGVGIVGSYSSQVCLLKAASGGELQAINVGRYGMPIITQPLGYANGHLYAFTCASNQRALIRCCMLPLPEATRKYRTEGCSEREARERSLYLSFDFFCSNDLDLKCAIPVGWQPESIRAGSGGSYRSVARKVITLEGGKALRKSGYSIFMLKCLRKICMGLRTYVFDAKSEKLALLSFAADGDVPLPLVATWTAEGHLMYSDGLRFEVVRLESLKFSDFVEFLSAAERFDSSFAQYSPICGNSKVQSLAFKRITAQAPSRACLWWTRNREIDPNHFHVVAGLGPVPRPLRATHDVYKKLRDVGELGEYLGGPLWVGRGSGGRIVEDLLVVDWWKQSRAGRQLLTYPQPLKSGVEAKSAAANVSEDRQGGLARWIGVVDVKEPSILEVGKVVSRSPPAELRDSFKVTSGFLMVGDPLDNNAVSVGAELGQWYSKVTARCQRTGAALQLLAWHASVDSEFDQQSSVHKLNWRDDGEGRRKAEEPRLGDTGYVVHSAPGRSASGRICVFDPAVCHSGGGKGKGGGGFYFADGQGRVSPWDTALRNGPLRSVNEYWESMSTFEVHFHERQSGRVVAAFVEAAAGGSWGEATVPSVLASDASFCSFCDE